MKRFKDAIVRRRPMPSGTENGPVLTPEPESFRNIRPEVWQKERALKENPHLILPKGQPPEPEDLLREAVSAALDDVPEPIEEEAATPEPEPAPTPRRPQIWDLDDEGEGGDAPQAAKPGKPLVLDSGSVVKPAAKEAKAVKAGTAKQPPADAPVAKRPPADAPAAKEPAAKKSPAERPAAQPAEPAEGPETAASRAKTRILGFHAQDMATDVFAGAKQPKNTAGRFPAGWIVVIDGPGRGAAFTVGTGVSTIGRGEDQSICLDFGDTSVSRSNHAMVAFDDEQKKFFIGHGGKSNVVRRNGTPVLTTEELLNRDLIRIGKTTLRFVALCGEDFTWDAGDDGAEDANGDG